MIQDIIGSNEILNNNNDLQDHSYILNLSEKLVQMI